MKLKSPDLPAIEPPHKIERSMTEAKENFYELAKSRTSFLDHKQFKAWVEKNMGVLGIYLRQDEDAAFFKISTGTAKNETTDIEKFICELEIVIDKEKFF